MNYDVFAYDCTPNYSTAAETSQTARDLETKTIAYVEDSYQKSEFPEYTHCRSTSLVTGNDGTNQRTALIRYPNLIGPGNDQIPDDAEIIKAHLTLTSTHPKNITVPVFKVTEYWCESGKSGRYHAPSWNERQKGISWTSPGCGEGSRESTPLDAVTITSGYSPYSWDVTSAVQAWADDRMQNKGLCFDAREQTDIQVFYSSDEEQFPQYRPSLEVEYVKKEDTTAPGISITTANVSDVSPAFVEGTCDSDAETIQISINGGDPADVIRLNPTQWYTNIEISETSAAHIAVTAKDAAENSSTAEQDIPWRATDIPLWCDITIRKGDSLLLTQTGTGSVLEIDPGTGVWENVGAPGDTLMHMYDTAGVYTVCSRIDGGAVSLIDVTVVDVNLHGPVACQVGFMRELDVFVTPVSAKESVDYSENDSRILHVEFNEYTDEGAALKLIPYTRGTPVLVARLGSNGPIVSTQEIDEFTLDVPAYEGVVIDDDIDVGTSKLTMRPYIPDLILEFDMFASTSTFEGGVTHFEVNTTDDFVQVFDEETGETVGKLLYDIEVPDEEDQYCFKIDVKQEMDPNEERVLVGDSGNINGKGCVVKVDQIYLCTLHQCEKILKVHIIKPNPECTGHNISICGGPAGIKPKFKYLLPKENPNDPDNYGLSETIKNGFVCKGNSPKEYLVNSCNVTPGIYDVKIKNTRFVRRIIVVRIQLIPDKVVVCANVNNDDEGSGNVYYDYDNNNDSNPNGTETGNEFVVGEKCTVKFETKIEPDINQLKTGIVEWRREKDISQSIYRVWIDKQKGDAAKQWLVNHKTRSIDISTTAGRDKFKNDLKELWVEGLANNGTEKLSVWIYLPDNTTQPAKTNQYVICYDEMTVQVIGDRAMRDTDEVTGCPSHCPPKPGSPAPIKTEEKAAGPPVDRLYFEKEDQCGNNRIEVWCIEGTVDYWAIYFNGVLVGKCCWTYAINNTGVYHHAGDDDNNGTVDRLLGTKWTSTGSTTQGGPVYTWEYKYDEATNTLTSTKYDAGGNKVEEKEETPTGTEYGDIPGP